ncbi:SRPBCC family protein [uncultured Ruegeria sp.]|uniref:SRPBCC family protein n=1 Tax=uncultured Ruegeria sp. TaxID=259304 RepID=UPI0026203879|nr:SRPBCC family protein [uncultured Ruegeria sp.]
MGICRPSRAPQAPRTRAVHLAHDYAFPAGLVWDVVTDFDHLQTVTKGVLAFRNLPSGQLFQGQHINVDVSLFGWMPYQPYEMTVLALDEEHMSFLSSEVGAGVKSWNHSLQVIPQTDGCRVSEQIEIDAGVATPLFSARARYLYRRRHKPRLQILADLYRREEAQEAKTEFRTH